MENEETSKRLQKELEEIEVQKEKNRKRVAQSEQTYSNLIIAEKKRKENQKSRASTYTLLTVFVFFINPAFGVFLALFFVADIIFNFLNLNEK